MSEARNTGRQILIDIIDDFSPDKFVRFFREKNRAFAPRKEELFQYDDDNFRNGTKLGEIQFAQDEQMVVCSFQAGQPLSERSGKKAQYEKGKKILKDSQSDAGIFIFHDTDNNFRFSLIYAEYLGVRRRFSYFKRLTFFVSPRLTNKTFFQQIGESDFSSLQKIKEAFSVEPVTRQFYGELQYWYFWAMDKIKFPDDYKYSNDHAKDKEIRDATNLIRLITRIVFIWFLTEKGLIPPELFSREKLGRIVKDFMKGKKASDFYNAILQNLFFGTLNQKMDERKFAQESGFQSNKKEYGVKNLYRYGDKFLLSKDAVLELFKDIPFLNGGLFDCLDKEDEAGKVIYVDGFSRNQAKQSIIPDYLFFQQEEERVDLSNYGLGASRPVRGLIEILNSYNFTVDENTLVDQEIALDPELLGRVFENLLASYNPETGTTARKQTGSFYTPREIVNYMVDESLIASLSNALTTGDKEDRLRHLFSYTDQQHQFRDEEADLLVRTVAGLKILDPACGSGAFPMGVLHKIVYILSRLDPDNSRWKQLHIEKVLKDTEEAEKIGDKEERIKRLFEIDEMFQGNASDYGRKLFLIENCIYGVDIQPIAVQISKLRFFISLIVDQRVGTGKKNLGIRPLPNLDTKFVAANSLIGIDQQGGFLKDRRIEKLEKELEVVRHKHFSAPTRGTKLGLQKRDKELRGEIATILKDGGMSGKDSHKMAKWDPYDQNASADFFDPEWMFGPDVKDGFDVVIGNPPYGADYSLNEKKHFQKYYVSTKTITGIQKGSLDTFSIFIELGYNLLRKQGNLSYIVPIAITSSDSMTALHKLLEENCHIIKTSSYSVRPQPVFENAVVNTSILYFIKTFTSCQYIYSTKMYRKNKDFDLQHLVDNLAFIDVKEVKLQGRYPKISYPIEKGLLKKIFKQDKTISDLLKEKGKAIYYRTTGGRYFKIITNYSTGSTKEKPIFFDKKIANTIGAILSSNLFFWFYQIYSNNLDLKSYEIESFTVPIAKLTDSTINKIETLYDAYLKDIENNANVRQTTRYANIDSFKEYKIGKSKALIDKIDDVICPLYGLAKKEIDFIKNYEIEYRLGDDSE